MSAKSFEEFERLTTQAAQLKLRLVDVEREISILRPTLLAAVVANSIVWGGADAVPAYVPAEGSDGVPEHVTPEVTVPMRPFTTSAPEVNDVRPVKRPNGLRHLDKSLKAKPLPVGQGKAPRTLLKQGELRAKVLDVVHKLGVATPSEIIKRTGSTIATINDALRRYTKTGYLKRHGKGKYGIGLKAHTESLRG